MSGLCITLLADNYVRQPGLLAEHGWACWIETPEWRILFDTGAGQALLHNARQLSIALESADAIVLSHGHYDHTGGLKAVLERAPAAGVYAHPAAFEAKYAAFPGGAARDIGVSSGLTDLPERLGERFVATRTATEVCPGVQVSGEIPRETEFEDAGGPFYLDPACKRPDDLVDDQALFFRTRHGTVVILGCAHAGIVNTLRRVASLTGDDRFRFVVGGTHLHAAASNRLDRTVSALRDLDVASIAPAHCTGLASLAFLREQLGDRCQIGGVGARFETPMPRLEPKG
jgi:7,8-dihydropterin-6-yl-methyl-4-(beta-D-ribofuranosyl)aminobenzene 5'-phosphate synthase